MYLVKKKTLADFWSVHPETEQPLLAWIKHVKDANWRSMNDVQNDFSKAKVLNAERARFEICGGNYRLVVSFAFKSEGGGFVYVKFIGTHGQYDRIDALTVNDY